MQMNLKYFVFAILVACAVNASERTSSVSSGSGKSIRQSMKDGISVAMEKVGYLFTNEIPHFFKKDVPEGLSEAENVVEKDVTTINDGMKKLEDDVQTEIKSIKFEECECANYSCGCCQHLEEPSIHLNSTLCVNITYLSEDIGISFTVTVNEYAIFNETVSVRNPPPVCLGVPYVKDYADACLRLYDIDATRTHLHACAQVEARMKHILIAKYELGCFDIGPIKSESNLQEPKHLQLEEPSIVLL